MNRNTRGGGAVAPLIIDPKAAVLSRAQEALRGLANHFEQWMRDEIATLEDARARIRDVGYTMDTAFGLYVCAYDLRVLGTTFDYPAVSYIADSLCSLLDDRADPLTAPMYLIDAHINSITVAVEGEMRDADDPRAKTLLAELQLCVDRDERTERKTEPLASLVPAALAQP
jgi:hypothetical protein